MNISSALKKIKVLRNELQRKIKIRRENFYVIIPKGATLEEVRNTPASYLEVELVDIYKMTEDINDIMNQISDLREQILITNIDTKVEVEILGKEVNLAKLKLIIDNYRSELAQLEYMKTSTYAIASRKKISTSKEEEKELPQLSDLELENKIKEVETTKNKLENILEYKNATTELFN